MANCVILVRWGNDWQFVKLANMVSPMGARVNAAGLRCWTTALPARKKMHLVPAVLGIPGRHYRHGTSHSDPEV
jgi:hypothetical protein